MMFIENSTEEKLYYTEIPLNKKSVKQKFHQVEFMLKETSAEKKF